MPKQPGTTDATAAVAVGVLLGVALGRCVGVGVALARGVGAAEARGWLDSGDACAVELSDPDARVPMQAVSSAATARSGSARSDAARYRRRGSWRGLTGSLGMNMEPP
jgi:hypothetical protein